MGDTTNGREVTVVDDKDERLLILCRGATHQECPLQLCADLAPVFADRFRPEDIHGLTALPSSTIFSMVSESTPISFIT